jgi:hypothetical protein
VIKSDNGLIFQSCRFRSTCRGHRLLPEVITPYTPEQNGIIERFFSNLKEAYVWQHRFESISYAKRAIAQRIEWYNTGRRHSPWGTRVLESSGLNNGCQWLEVGGVLHISSVAAGGYCIHSFQQVHDEKAYTHCTNRRPESNQGVCAPFAALYPRQSLLIL